MLYSNKHFEKPAKSSISLPCALLKSKGHTCQCRQTQLLLSPRVCFPYLQQYSLGLLTGGGLSAVTFLSLVVVNPSSPPAHWCACPLCLICCCQHLLGTVALGSQQQQWRLGERSLMFLESTGAVPTTSSFGRVVSWAGVPISTILDLGTVWWDTQSFALCISNHWQHLPVLSSLPLLTWWSFCHLSLDQEPVRRNCSEDDEMTC